MIVMPSNSTGFNAGRLFGMYPKLLAHLNTPDNQKEPMLEAPWALDNGVFGAFTTGREWSEEPFYSYLEKFVAWKPMWAVVPDCVGQRERTMELWKEHAPAVKAFGVKLAFAAQDGMTPGDVPEDADVVFVGGSTSWKWRNLKTWTDNFPRVHVGRVNSRRLLDMAAAAGAESCDGTGWFRDPLRTKELETWLSCFSEGGAESVGEQLDAFEHSGASHGPRTIALATGAG